MKAMAANAKHILKIASLALALAMAISLVICMPAFADEAAADVAVSSEGDLVDTANALAAEPANEAAPVATDAEQAEADDSATPVATPVVEEADSPVSPTATVTVEEAQTAPAITASASLAPADATEPSAPTYGYDASKEETFTLTADLGKTAATEALYGTFKSGVTDYTKVEWNEESNTFTAWFDTFCTLLANTWAMDEAWNEGKAAADRVLFISHSDNAKLALTATLKYNSRPLYNVDFLFTHVTVANDGDESNSFNWPSNPNDDGYFHFISEGHVTMQFEDCDLLQNVQSGSQGESGISNVDLTFIRCNFNGDKVITIAERSERNGKDPYLLWGEGHDGRYIFNSYFGDNIGSLIIKDCVNLRSVNANGMHNYGSSFYGENLDADHNPSIISVTGCTFIDLRQALEDQGVGGMLLYAKAFANYVFENNTWADGSGIVWVEAFKNIDFGGFVKADFFYPRGDATGAFTEGEHDVPGNWYLEIDGANAMVKSVGIASTDCVVNRILIYAAATPILPDLEEEDEDPGTDPEDEEDPSTNPEDEDEGEAPVPVDEDEVPAPVDEGNDPNPDSEDEELLAPVAAPTTPTTPPTTPTTTTTPNTPVAPTITTFLAVAAPVPVAAAMTIVDDANPLADVVEIEDEENPLAGGVVWALYNFALMELTIFMSLVLLVSNFMRTRKEEEDDDSPRKHTVFRILSIPVAIIAVIAFVLTEDIHVPLVLIDQWTPLMLVIAIVQTVMVLLSRRSYREEEDGKTPQTTAAAA